MIPGPIIASPELRQALRDMLEELDWRGLDVSLIPAPEQRHSTHFIRVVRDRNPGWYRDLCAAYQRRRRVRAARFVDPLFKRDDVTGVIRRLLGGGSRSYLAGPLLDIARIRGLVWCDEPQYQEAANA